MPLAATSKIGEFHTLLMIFFVTIQDGQAVVFILVSLKGIIVFIFCVTESSEVRIFAAVVLNSCH